MRMFLLTLLAMAAFAANSVLNRAAVGLHGMDPMVFGTIRLAAGAFALALMITFTLRGFALGGSGRVVAVAGLLLYIFGFSLAYQRLDAGLGALILFGVVQITMFAGALVGKERFPRNRWIGAVLALCGLAWLLWPGGSVQVTVVHVTLMVAAGIGWGVYSLQGRRETDATQATAMNFILAAPFALIFMRGVPSEGTISTAGVALALTSGIITSGLGYSLWYRLLPELGASRAAVAQLTVPVLAMAGGMVLLAEPLTLQFSIAALLVIGGVLVSMRN
ncbi:MAG: DMT family transporter [Paracoccaceae bacterium]|jgi:drug/metabolite transporter (DMT)-like permease|nr:DMT family transporter [Paracoccaceae bacterium]